MKYAALLLSALALALLGWGLTGLGSTIKMRAVPVRPPALELKPLAEKDTQEQADIFAALKAISGLAAQRSSGASTTGMPLVALPVPGAPGSDGPLIPTRRVTLLLRSGTEAMAVVDGTMVKEGQRLAGGGRVRKIGDGGVLLSETNGRQTLGVPLDTLRVGTLHRPNSKAPDLAVQVPRSSLVALPARQP